MPNVASILKAEITRIARKEIKTELSPLRKAATKQRSDIAALKRQIVTLEQRNKSLRGALEKTDVLPPAATQEPADTAEKGWISGKGVKSLRNRLKLTQAEFGKLVGVTVKSVNTWEQKPGMLKLHAATKDALFAIRGIGIKEARQRLEA